MHLGRLKGISKPVFLHDAYSLVMEILGYVEAVPWGVRLVTTSSELFFLLHIDVLRASRKLADLFFLSSDEF
jgi:hypothetical protein